MKLKLFIKFFILPIVSINISSLTTSCNSGVQAFFSSNISTNAVNFLFEDKNNDIDLNFPICFDYLTYNSGGWSHVNFENILVSLKTKNELINFDDDQYKHLSNSDKDFLNNLANYAGIKNENGFNFTGLTFNVENIFINSINYDSIDTGPIVDVDCAVTIANGWNSVSKALLTISTDPNYFTNYETLLFINTLLKVKFSNISIINGSNYIFRIIDTSNIINDKEMSGTFNSYLKSVFSKISLSDLSYQWFDKTDGNDYSGFSLLGYNYYIQ